MKFRVLAILKEYNRNIGLRVMDANETIYNYTFNKIGKLLDEGHSIKNIRKHENKLVWDSRIFDRYPIINLDEDRVWQTGLKIVIGKYEESNNTYYITINAVGDKTILEKDELIEYAKKNLTSNCEVVDRNGGSVLTFSEDIEDLPGVVFSFEKYTGHVKAVVLDRNIYELEIPDIINGTDIDGIYNIEISTKVIGHNIRHLILPESLSRAECKSSDAIKNIQSMSIKGEVKSVDLTAFEGLKKLRIDKVSNVEGRIRLPKSLEEIEFGVKPKVYKAGMFKGCSNLNVDRLLYEGLVAIEDVAFSEMGQLVEVKLPKSLRILSETSFFGCKNIERVYINNNILNIDRMSNRPIHNRYEGGALLLDSEKARLFCSYEFPISKLKGVVAPHVKIVRDKPKIDLEELRIKGYKALVVGASIRLLEPAQNIEEMIWFIKLAQDKVFNEQLHRALEDAVYNRVMVSTIENNGMYMDILTRDIAYGDGYAADLIHTENYSVILFETNVVVLISSRRKLEGYVSRQIKERIESSIVVHGAGDVGARKKLGQGVALIIPFRAFMINSNEITDISEKNGAVLINTINQGVVSVEIK